MGIVGGVAKGVAACSMSSSNEIRSGRVSKLLVLEMVDEEGNSMDLAGRGGMAGFTEGLDALLGGMCDDSCVLMDATKISGSVGERGLRDRATGGGGGGR